ncbi:helix-turn-helix domain-containing protein [Nonomuraea glycinis]|uniref:XRE family transcriptional regulator n=1 Tax=Nonomuraea glycinis TaxID=2047744 RepID=A0A918AD26_9ACTN|nr:helix-turn-helix transcriptional regulator [Nonomuraea glycinis]MCA2181698.1 helix-turn-helix domain-containing protein [Nonomuraea glycinis]GGP14898.1 hypothetical protein GCM10012278_72490 [Nonomuraea glycinis]
MNDAPAWAARLRAERTSRQWSQRQLARRLAEVSGAELPEPESLIRIIRGHERGEHRPDDRYAELYCRAYSLSEAVLFDAAEEIEELGDEIDAMELVRRAEASDVGRDTLERLETAVDDLASAYPSSPPGVLLGRVRRHLGYVSRLLDGRKTITEHRRLLVSGGWLSLLGATCHIDLHQYTPAAARLRTAVQLARHAGHAELTAWCVETEAWQVLVDGDYQRAVTLSQGAQAIAPKGSSVFIQATAQEGRAWARLGDGPATRDALNRVHRLVSPLSPPDRPEHHYRYDPAKSDAYTATTLSWIGDPAAVPYARQVLARLDTGADGRPRPRRAALARLDLALALLATDQPDEAVDVTLAAIRSGEIVPSSYWRTSEIITGVERRALPEASALRDAYSELCVRRRAENRR